MRFRPCTVIVMQLPEQLNTKQGRRLLAELERRMNVDRPCVVLDCGKVRELDKYAIQMLLCCLEEAMKRNGDVKLAALSSAACDILESTRVDRLFEIYETDAEAASSYRRSHFAQATYTSIQQSSDETSESAA